MRYVRLACQSKWLKWKFYVKTYLIKNLVSRENLVLILSSEKLYFLIDNTKKKTNCPIWLEKCYLAQVLILKFLTNMQKGFINFFTSRRRNYHGFNEVSGKEADPIWRKYLDQFNNPFILLLLASAAIR